MTKTECIDKGKENAFRDLTKGTSKEDLEIRTFEKEEDQTVAFQ